MLKKFLIIAAASVSFTSMVYAAYTPVDCSSNGVFGENSCNQCFDGGEVKVGDVLSVLDDVWVNDTSGKKIMYKEEQKMPELKALNGAEFTKKPNDDTFWEYTPEFEALKDTQFDGYVLPAGQKVSWLKSGMASGYKVEKTANAGENAGLLVFDVTSHNIGENGEVDMNNNAHKECVVYRAGAGVAQTPVIEETPIPQNEPTPQAEEMTQVKTGPELYFLVLILSFLLAFGVTHKNLILAKIRK